MLGLEGRESNSLASLHRWLRYCKSSRSAGRAAGSNSVPGERLIRRERPIAAWKMALTMEGGSALGSGTSRAIVSMSLFDNPAVR